MTFIEILKKDHEEVKQLFSQIESGGNKEKLFSQIKEELELHMMLEEKFLYPAMEKSESEVKEKTLEAYEEHHVAKTVLAEIGKVSPSNERWKAKVSVLKEVVDHHIQEEEKELFKMAKKVLDTKEMQQITEKIQQGKKAKAK
jgi:iron-sulfur cluster repair protein YtfE (RIC family)